MRTRNTIALTTLLCAAPATTALADMTGNVYQNTRNLAYTDGFGAPDFDGVVVDIWLEFDDLDDVLLNIYNFNDPNLGTNYYQSITGNTWLPNNLGLPFRTPALLFADSFVSIGDYGNGKQGNTNGTGLDPNFGGANAPGPGENAGWYNSDPSSLIGQAVQTEFTSTGIGVFIGRFAVNGAQKLDFFGLTGFATWNQGIGTDASQGQFIKIPAPGALALLGIAGLAGRRRRQS